MVAVNIPAFVSKNLWSAASDLILRPFDFDLAAPPLVRLSFIYASRVLDRTFLLSHKGYISVAY